MKKTNITETYNKLVNNEKSYIEALKCLILYKMTNGKSNKNADNYLNSKETIRFYTLCIPLVFLLNFSSSLYWYTMNYDFSTIYLLLQLSIIALGMIGIKKLIQFKKKSKIYQDVFAYLNLLNPKDIKDLYDYYCC